MKRQRKEHIASFDERIADHLQELKEQASRLPPGKERDELMRRVRQAETASHITEWLTSPGLAAPK
jgi:hypothetical protein